VLLFERGLASSSAGFLGSVHDFITLSTVRKPRPNTNGPRDVPRCGPLHFTTKAVGLPGGRESARKLDSQPLCSVAFGPVLTGAYGSRFTMLLRAEAFAERRLRITAPIVRARGRRAPRRARTFRPRPRGKTR
jgi:hypothetical protein